MRFPILLSLTVILSLLVSCSPFPKESSWERTIDDPDYDQPFVQKMIFHENGTGESISPIFVGRKLHTEARLQFEYHINEDQLSLSYADEPSNYSAQWEIKADELILTPKIKGQTGPSVKYKRK